MVQTTEADAMVGALGRIGRVKKKNLKIILIFVKTQLVDTGRYECCIYCRVQHEFARSYATSK